MSDFQKAMTQEHLTDQQVEAYRERAVDASARNALASHLAACESCLQRVIDTAHLDVAFASLKESFLSPGDEEPFHLSREELKRYAEGKLNQADRTIFESHLEDCAECNGLAQDLLLASPVVATQARARRNLSTPQTAWMSFTDYWRRSPLRPVYIGGIALLLIGVSFLIFLFQSKYSGGRDQSVPQQSASSNGQDQSRPTPPINQPGTQQGAETVSNNGERLEKEVVNDRGTSPFTRAPRTTPEIIVSLVDGEQAVTLDRRGHLTGFEGMTVPIQRAVRHALSSKEIKKPEALDELSAPGITLLGQPANALPFALLAPTGNVILDDRPAFNWQPLPGATNYTISVFDSNFNRVLRSEPQAVTNWSPPAPLKRGRIYFWEATALKEGQEITSPVAPAPRAQFKIVDEETAREINQVKGARPTSHLALGILYARAGLLDDAEREFQLLVNANPRSEVARTFLSRVRSWKRP